MLIVLALALRHSLCRSVSLETYPLQLFDLILEDLEVKFYKFTSHNHTGKRSVSTFKTVKAISQQINIFHEKFQTPHP